MSIRIGDVDVANEIVDLHYQIIRTQLILEFLLSKNTNIVKPATSDLAGIDSKALEMIQKKFPNMGIQKKA